MLRNSSQNIKVLAAHVSAQQGDETRVLFGAEPTADGIIPIVRTVDANTGALIKNYLNTSFDVLNDLGDSIAHIGENIRLGEVGQDRVEISSSGLSVFNGLDTTVVGSDIQTKNVQADSMMAESLLLGGENVVDYIVAQHKDSDIYNWSWDKYHSGHAVAWRKIAFTINIDFPYEYVYYKETPIWSFPFTFIQAPLILSAIRSDSGLQWHRWRTIDTTQMQGFVANPRPAENNPEEMMVKLIGRWR